MIKRKIIFIVITIFIIAFVFATACYGFTPATTELYNGLYDGKVIAYSEMRAFRFNSCNGAVLAYSTVSGDTYQIVTEQGRNVSGCNYTRFIF